MNPRLKYSALADRLGRPSASPAARSQRPPMPYSGAPLVQLESMAGPLWIGADDDVVRSQIANSGAWDRAEGEFLLSQLEPGGTFIDVGAHIGYFSLLIANTVPGVKVLSFEPHPVNGHALELNAWSSPGNIKVHRIALSDQTGTVALNSAATNLGDTRALEPSAGQAANMISACASFDDLYPNMTVDVVKIDVQGNEFSVITGMVNTLLRSPSPVVTAEFAPHILRERDLDPVAVLASYRKLGFHLRFREGTRLFEMPIRELVARCDTAGVDSQVDVVLTKADKPKRATKQK